MVGRFESEESVFNMALAYLKRIDKVLYMCWCHSRQGDIETWLNDLRALYRELSVKLNEAEEKDILGNGSSDTIDLDTLKSSDANFQNIYSLVKVKQNLKKQKKEILFLLDQLEVKMRKLLQKKGMLLPSREDPRFAVLKR